MSARQDFGFGLEAEYLLVEADTHRPLWYRDLSFEAINAAMEAIPDGDLPPLEGLELERPHRKRMCYMVEGYHVPDPDFNPIDLWPKGVEIRTPVCSSIEACLDWLATLHQRLAAAMSPMGYRMAALSHHPIEHHFDGPQNKRRYDFWQWAMEVMLTYGPDINISLPSELEARLDLDDLHAKVNYYGPAMAALSLGSPLYRGGLWTIRGRVGKSVRTHRRSVVAPALEVHPEENGRLELKLFEMTCSLADFHGYFLLWLAVLLDETLDGRASRQTCVYDLGQIARLGLEAETIRDRAASLLEHAPAVLLPWGFHVRPLEQFQARLDRGRLPADWIVEVFHREGTAAGVLRHLTELNAGPSPLGFASQSAESRPAVVQDVSVSR